MGCRNYGLLALLWSTASVSAAGLPIWQPVSQGVAPSPRFRALVATDNWRNYVVLYGGTNTAGALFDTWIWNGAQWRFVTSDGPGVAAASMAFDERRGVVVLYGGYRDHFSDETWEFDGTRWQKVAGNRQVCEVPNPNAPVGLVSAAMAFDPESQSVLLFGGGTECYGWRQETWAWNGIAWTLVSTSGPGRRLYPTMASDPITNRVILFGGSSDGPVPGGGYLLGDTWQWKAGTWSQLPDAPARRSSHGAAFDSRLDCFIVFGGTEVPNGFAPQYSDPRRDTPALRAATWVPGTDCDGPAGRYGPSLAFDPVRQRIIMFGGQVPGPNYSLATVNEMFEFVADAAPCTGDLNGDGLVDDSDFVLFADAYDALYDPVGNFEIDNCNTDDRDFVIFARAYDALLCP